MPAEMTGRVCVITGASRGIGKASAEALAVWVPVWHWFAGSRPMETGSPARSLAGALAASTL